MAVLLQCSCQTTKVDTTPVPQLDLERYLGTWYEIARYDHPFERGMQQTKATYSLRSDGRIEVLNDGIRKGKFHEAKGKAKRTENPGVLRVSFFGPFYSDYRVLWIDATYSQALVGSGSDAFLWILSRSPYLEDSVKTTILSEAKRRGYDVSKLIYVNHESSAMGH